MMIKRCTFTFDEELMKYIYIDDDDDFESIEYNNGTIAAPEAQ